MIKAECETNNEKVKSFAKELSYYIEILSKFTDWINDKSKEENTKICWSIPRKQSINTYTTAGFIKDSHWFSTETNEENCIVIKKL